MPVQDEKSELEILLERLTSQIGENFDSVLVLASWVDGGNTNLLIEQTGNHFAHVAMAEEFLHLNERDDVEAIVRGVIDESEDDDDKP